MKCIIPCAGRATRMKTSVPKVLLEVRGETLLSHIIQQWKGRVDNFILVVNQENEKLIKSHLPDAEFVIQEEPRGLANAILQAETRIDGPFIVSLGDCFYTGQFETKSGSVRLGIGTTIMSSPEINKNYVVHTSPHTGLVTQLVEKPEGEWLPSLGGMGVYFLQPGIFDYLRKDPNGDFTHILQFMIDSGEKIFPVHFVGTYINVTYPEDLKRAETL